MRLAHWFADLQRAARTLRRTPGFVGMAVGMLGLAIGVTAGMFSVVNTVLLDRLPYANPDRLVFISASAPGSDMPAEFQVSPELFLQYREQSRLLEDSATSASGTSTLRVGDRVERVRMGWPTNSLFSTLGAVPVLGRLPLDSDEDNAVVISYGLWNDWFGRDPNVVGARYFVSDKDRTIVGVMGADFRYPYADVRLWVSGTMKASDIKETGDFDYDMVGRMVPGATHQALAEELTTLARRVPERFGGTPSYLRTIEQHRAVVRSLEDRLLGAYARPLWVLLGASVIVLLIACANVANLFLVRSEGRRRELAVRNALGASRGALLRLQLAEATLIALLAGGVAIVLAAFTLPLFLQAAPRGIPRLDAVGVDASMIVFTAFAAAVSALVCGGLAALRDATPDMSRLREGGRGSTAAQHWLRNALVAGQTALALVLLIGSALLLRSVWELRQVKTGYDTRDILSFQIAPDRPELNSPLTYAHFNLAFLERLAALPSVQSVGLIENVPIDEGTATLKIRTEAGAADTGEGIPLHATYSAGDYFKTMGIALLGGRPFTTDDQIGARGNVIVSRSAAELLWPGKDAVGQRLQRAGRTSWETVVGVVDDVLQDGLQGKPEALVYFPMVGPAADFKRQVSSPGYVVRTTRADTIAPQIRALVKEIAPEAPMYRVNTMEALVERSMTQLNFTLLTLGITALLALVLGAVGLYAVLSYIVAERRREIGVRMALGANAMRVRAMVVAQGARVVGVGLVMGLLVAFATTRALGSLLYGVQATDAATFIIVPLLMAMVGVLASYLPARRASNLDPMEALRRE